MKAAGFAFLMLFLCTAGAVAQTPAVRAALLSDTGAGLPVQSQALSSAKVLALLVQFKEDSDPLTTGNGSFELSAGDPTAIDPPPHDTSFFHYKLRFLENYFRKVSRGQLNIEADLFPQMVTLPDSMALYAPGPEDSLARLIRLVSDSWGAASVARPTFPFANYDAFIIFHAGAGRDIDLVSILGYDPTPLDLPSIYVSLQSMRTHLHDPAYAGVPVGNGNFHITNSLILPETESRVFDTTVGTDTLHLSTNGLLAASFGSFLGLPDLFDTNTGRSGIGQFGLMDGASIFAYNGLFPPEPCAWEKAYLGWIQPIRVAPGTHALELPAAGLSPASPDSVYRVDINATEYYLIENRSRDPQGNGQVLTLYENGALVQRTYLGDTTGFQVGDVSGIGGSVVDAQDFDWALPGASGQAGFEGGGILVWHIDESVIEEKIAENAVNADPDRRGVDLEEADGSQDIGQSYELLDPGSGTENGWPLDFWFAGNSAPIYKNAFDNSSFPNSKANSGASSLVALSDFSTRSTRMTVTVRIGSSTVSSLPAFTRSVAGTGLPAHPALTGSSILVTEGGRLLVLDASGSEKMSDSLALPPSSRFSDLAAFDYVSGTIRRTMVFASGDSTIRIFRLTDIGSNGTVDSVSFVDRNISDGITTPVVVPRAGATWEAVVGTDQGRLCHLSSADSTLTYAGTLRTAPVSSIASLPTGTPGVPPDVYYVAGDSLFGPATSVALPPVDSSWLLIGVVSTRTTLLVAAGHSSGRILAFGRDLGDPLFDIQNSLGGVLALAAADVDGDGNKDVVVTSRGGIVAVNERGVPLDGFPVRARSGQELAGETMIADLSGDSKPELVVIGADGEVLVIGSDGKLVPGYPLQLFDLAPLRCALFATSAQKIGLLSVSGVASSSGPIDALRAYEFSASYSAARVPWPQYFQNGMRLNFDQSTTQNPVPVSSQFLPPDRVYNWPNPVYGNTTQIRYFVPVDAAIRVEIFDLAGLKIAELNGQAVGGVDGELTWDVSGIQSGVYLARVEATSAQTSNAVMIKVAVVK